MGTVIKSRALAIQGTANLIGTVACLIIAVELYEDLTEHKAHFRLPKAVKVVALCGFAFWSVLEAQKVRRRLDSLLGVSSDAAAGSSDVRISIAGAFECASSTSLVRTT